MLYHYCKKLFLFDLLIYAGIIIAWKKLKFKVIWSTGEVTGWAYYHLRTEDVMAENWEVV